MKSRIPLTTLVSMPWANLHMPSIQLGILESLMRQHNLPVRSLTVFLRFMDFLRQKSDPDFTFTVDDYYLIADWSFLNGMGDWVFAGEPYMKVSAEQADTYLRVLAGFMQPRGVEACKFARQHAPEFVRQMAAEILREGTQIVGFSSTFAQNVPSLSLARAIKEANPDVTIVFGGANCEASMGEALLAAFPWVDYVVRGEGEYALPRLVRSLCGQGDVSETPGLCFRRDSGIVAVPFNTEISVNPDDMPEPVYDEYFDFVNKTALGRDIRDMIRIPVESSRGCWWGDKHHCTFCGLNGLTMAFRSKDPGRFLGELLSLSEKYATTAFHAADNILDMRYFKSVIPSLTEAREAGYDFTFFYEMKANLNKEQVAMLRDAGIHKIQPGIESLSTNILKLIDKGVTSIQNIQLLKWAREYRLTVEWYLIHGFPGETEADWQAVYDLIPLISHLQPPKLIPLLLERFSPYFDRPEHYQMTNLGPKKWYRFLYPISDEEMNKIAYYFDYASSKTVARPILDKVQARLNQLWNPQLFHKNVGTLTYGRGPGFVRIVDRRLGLKQADMVLRGLTAEVFLECDSICTPQALAKTFGRSEAEIAEICEGLRKASLLLEEDGKYLALPVAVRPTVTNRTAQAVAAPAPVLA